MFIFSASPRSSSAKSLWKRRAINSTMNVKRKCLLTSEQTDRDRKKPIQTNGNGRKLRMNTDSSNTQSDETTYCLCSQVSRRKKKQTSKIEWLLFEFSYPMDRWFFAIINRAISNGFISIVSILQSNPKANGFVHHVERIEIKSLVFLFSLSVYSLFFFLFGE